MKIGIATVVLAAGCALAACRSTAPADAAPDGPSAALPEIRYYAIADT